MEDVLETKINNLLNELFREDWMDDNDWNEFIIQLEVHSGVTISSLKNDLEVCIKNGYSIDTQFDLIRKVLNK